jgi:hypothetical protein
MAFLRRPRQRSRREVRRRVATSVRTTHALAVNDGSEQPWSAAYSGPRWGQPQRLWGPTPTAETIPHTAELRGPMVVFWMMCLALVVGVAVSLLWYVDALRDLWLRPVRIASRHTARRRERRHGLVLVLESGLQALFGARAVRRRPPARAPSSPAPSCVRPSALALDGTEPAPVSPPTRPMQRVWLALCSLWRRLRSG